MIAAEDGEPVLTSQGSDPDIVGGYRLALAFEFGADGGIEICGDEIHVEDVANADQFGQPGLIAKLMSRLVDALSIFADDNYGAA